MQRQSTRITLAQNLKYLMEKSGWKQEQLAAKAGVSQRSVSNLLRPETHSPTLETVDAVAKAFGLNLWHLILPSLPEDLENDTSIREVYEAFRASSHEGRAHILQVAEREAEYAKRAK